MFWLNKYLDWLDTRGNFVTQCQTVSVKTTTLKNTILHRANFVASTSLNVRQNDSGSVVVGMSLSDETLKAAGPFYLVSMPEEVKDPTRGNCVNRRGLHILA